MYALSPLHWKASAGSSEKLARPKSRFKRDSIGPWQALNHLEDLWWLPLVKLSWGHSIGMPEGAWDIQGLISNDFCFTLQINNFWFALAGKALILFRSIKQLPCLVLFVQRAFWYHPTRLTVDASTLVKLWRRKLKKTVLLTPNLERPLTPEPMFCPPLTSTTLGQSWSLPQSWCQSSERKRHSCLLSIKIQIAFDSY